SRLLPPCQPHAPAPNRRPARRRPPGPGSGDGVSDVCSWAYPRCGRRFQDFSRVQMPMAMKPAPAIHCSWRGETYCPTTPPASTPSAEVAISASEAPAKISHLLTSLSEANSIVASWVLSPNSATNTVANTVYRILMYMPAHVLGPSCYSG